MRLFVLALCIFVLPTSVFAYVENVTHGYVNCMACHHSPSGGGVLTPYGRSLSKELMSTWGGPKNFEKSAFGAIKDSDTVAVGGDFRSVQTYYEDSNVKQGKQFAMQRNVEVGVRISNVRLIGTLGTSEGPSQNPDKGEFLSERHYAIWDISDEIKLRAGKFRLNYGLYDPNHTRATKAGLGFGSYSESYILEFSKFSDTGEIFVSANLGRLDSPNDRGIEKSFSYNYARYVTDKAKIGANILGGESDQKRRTLFGGYGVFPLFEKWVVKYEGDFERSVLLDASRTRNDLFAAVTSAGYQLAKGLLPYAIAEYLHGDLDDNSTKSTSIGAGVQWLPLPHFELQAEYKATASGGASTDSNSGWVLFHFYL